MSARTIGTAGMMGFACAVAVLAAGCRSSEPGGTVACTPGVTIQVACGAGCGLGTCTGDPVLRICDGSVGVRECARGDGIQLGFNDDGCGSLCPGTTVVCPPGGSITVSHRPFSSGASYRCLWEAQPLGGSTGGLTSGEGDAGTD